MLTEEKNHSIHTKNKINISFVSSFCTSLYCCHTVLIKEIALFMTVSWHPGQVVSLSQAQHRETTKHTFTFRPTEKLELPVQLMCMLVIMSLERYTAMCYLLRHAIIVTIRNTGVTVVMIWALPKGLWSKLSCCSKIKLTVAEIGFFITKFFVVFLKNLFEKTYTDFSNCCCGNHHLYLCPINTLWLYHALLGLSLRSPVYDQGLLLL